MTQENSTEVATGYVHYNEKEIVLKGTYYHPYENFGGNFVPGTKVVARVTWTGSDPELMLIHPEGNKLVLTHELPFYFNGFDDPAFVVLASLLFDTNNILKELEANRIVQATGDIIQFSSKYQKTYEYPVVQLLL